MRENYYSSDLVGLARRCPYCKIVAHFEVKGRKAVKVTCPLCDKEFEVKKYRRSERPTAK